jgi:hypothetical protein
MRTIRMLRVCSYGVMAVMVAAAQPGILGPYSSSSNFAGDLYGSLDQRAGCWGFADSTEWAIAFHPPVGYRVRILRLAGDLIAWPKVLPGNPPVASGVYAGVLLGFHTSAPGGSANCDFCDDSTMVYVQDGLDSHPVRAPFDRSLSVLLESDNQLLVKVASWLNTTGYPIHMEPTFTVSYRYEPAASGTQQ